MLSAFSATAALVLAPAAQAARTEVAAVVAFGGPVFAGDRLVYGSEDQGQLHQTVVEPDGTHRLLRVLGPVSEPVSAVEQDDGFYSYFAARFDASATVVATGVDRRSGWRDLVGSEAGSLDAGPLDGPYTDLTACSLGWDRGFAVDGDRVAYTRVTSCSADADSEIVVRDSRAGSKTVIPHERFVGYTQGLVVRLAGRFVAWTDIEGTNGIVVVHDLETGSERRVPAGMDFALQPDGSVVRLNAAANVLTCGTVDVIAPGDGSARQIEDCALGGVLDRDGDRIVYVRARRRRGSITGAELVVGRTDGSNRQPVLSWSGRGRVIRSADLAGGRLAYAVDGCTFRAGGTVYVDDLAGGTVPRERVNCSARLTGNRLRLQPGGFLQYRLTCPAGCHGALYLQRRAGRRWVYERGFSDLDLDTSGEQRWYLEQATVNVIRRSRRPLRFRLTGQIDSRGGGSHRDVTFPLTVRR